MSLGQVNSVCQTEVDSNTMKTNKRPRNEMVGDEESAVESADIKSLLLSLTAKIDSLNDNMCGNDARLNSKIDNLEAALTSKITDVKEEMETRIDSIAQELGQRFNKHVTDTNQRCENSSSSLLELTHRLDQQYARHEYKLDTLERLSLENDLIITGVPMENNEDPMNVLGDICQALDSKLQSGDFISVFRLRNGKINHKTKHTVPIAVKVKDDWAKRELLTAYFKIKNLNLKDIGYKTATRIYINERLTAKNREIFNRAAEAKKAGLVQRFFTRKGLVYTQRDEKSRPEVIVHISDIDNKFPVNHGHPHSSRGNRFLHNKSSNQSHSHPSSQQPTRKSAVANNERISSISQPSQSQNQPLVQPSNQQSSADQTDPNSNETDVIQTTN